jgi:hypothetical protein
VTSLRGGPKAQARDNLRADRSAPQFENQLKWSPFGGLRLSLLRGASGSPGLLRRKSKWRVRPGQRLALSDWLSNGLPRGGRPRACIKDHPDCAQRRIPSG